MKLTTANQWRKTIAWLKRNFPVRHPVRVRSLSMKKFHGYTTFVRRNKYVDITHFQIKICRKESYELRIDALIHEWAHCLTWFGAEADEDHSSEWGIAYAKIYRTFLEWNYGCAKTESQ